jgi:hypothetical protein
MAIIVTPAAEDFVFGRVLDNRWFRFRVEKVETKPGKTDPNSTNILMTIKCLGPADTKGNTAGVEIQRYFPMAKLGFLVQFMNDTKLVEAVPGERLNVEALVGGEFDGQNEQREYEGKMQNNLKNVAPAGKFVKNEELA